MKRQEWKAYVSAFRLNARKKLPAGCRATFCNLFEVGGLIYSLRVERQSTAVYSPDPLRRNTWGAPVSIVPAIIRDRAPRHLQADALNWAARYRHNVKADKWAPHMRQISKGAHAAMIAECRGYGSAFARLP
ncbi:hypothetical protein HDIA_0724 [Hartmannibacter diazotrophicus]|uniref:Uncharacterized protein n=1 Tax=Hartmannibacter diazotrophicus TaxID=1482074 RepID=A0A2C9D453_9HYPH|nr:hypothetical protein [Hartmannibacter diazotrophicus]SON54265.1 hypothetical protein HDIA_0724 [Hartmannibacter diazotrophicus]